MRGSGSDGVEDLAACGLLTHQVVPSSFSELPGSSGAAWTAAGVENAASICSGFQTGAPWRGALGAIVGRPAFLSSCTGEVAGIGRQFCAPWGNTRGVNRAVGCAVFFRGGCRTGGCHQTREANTDCSMHWHCIVSFLLGIPLPVAMNLAVPCQITLDGGGNANRRWPVRLRQNRASKVGIVRLDKPKRCCQPTPDFRL